MSCSTPSSLKRSKKIENPVTKPRENSAPISSAGGASSHREARQASTPPQLKTVAIGVLLYAFDVAGLRHRLETAAEGRQIRSIAVLLFDNASGDPNREYLSAGGAETITGSLSQLPGLRVMAYESVLAYKGRHTDPCFDKLLAEVGLNR